LDGGIVKRLGRMGKGSWLTQTGSLTLGALIGAPTVREGL
jgi:hypothetical protein